jgi:hypothetical protein
VCSFLFKVSSPTIRSVFPFFPLHLHISYAEHLENRIFSLAFWLRVVSDRTPLDRGNTNRGFETPTPPVAVCSVHCPLAFPSHFRVKEVLDLATRSARLAALFVKVDAHANVSGIICALQSTYSPPSAAQASSPSISFCSRSICIRNASSIPHHLPAASRCSTSPRLAPNPNNAIGGEEYTDMGSEGMYGLLMQTVSNISLTIGYRSSPTSIIIYFTFRWMPSLNNHRKPAKTWKLGHTAWEAMSHFRRKLGSR